MKLIIKFIAFSVLFSIFAFTKSNAQSDSSTSRLIPLTQGPTQPTGLTALTQGPRLQAIGTDFIGEPNTFCSRAYQNSSGVVLAVTLYGPEFGDTILFAMQRPTTSQIWTAIAQVNNSTSAQGFIAPGGLFCVLSNRRRGTGTFDVTVFKENASASDYPQIYFWADTATGFCLETITQTTADDSITRQFERQVFRRDYNAIYGARPSEYYFNGSNGLTRASGNPTGGECIAL